jgi:hypothetical protein
VLLIQNFFFFQVGLKVTMELLRVVPQLFSLAYKILAPNLTRRERESPYLGLTPSHLPGEFNQTVKLPDFFLAILLLFAFSAIAPLLSYFAGFFLFVADIVYRRQVLFVYDPSTQSSGVFWPKCHDGLVGALIIAQLTFLGLITVKIAPGPIFMATLLPIFTTVYYFYSNSVWPRTGHNLPLDLCSRLDLERMDKDKDPNALAFLDGVYVQPALREKDPLRPENCEGDDSGSQFELVNAARESEGGTPRA